MKVLVMYVKEFSYLPAEKNLDDVETCHDGATYTNAILAFIHVEHQDEGHDAGSRAKKLVSHLKWTGRKNQCTRFILHSFSHLSVSRASIGFTRAVLDQAEWRLKNAGMDTAQTPFGHFLDLRIEAPGYSLARIWAEL